MKKQSTPNQSRKCAFNNALGGEKCDEPPVYTKALGPNFIAFLCRKHVTYEFTLMYGDEHYTVV